MCRSLLPSAAGLAIDKDVKRLNSTLQRFAATLALVLAPAPALAASHDVRLPPLGCVGPPSDTWLNVTIDKVRSDRGVIALTVYPDDQRKFLIDGGSLYVGRVPARAEKTRMCLFLPQPGIYALAVYHDEDNSGALNRIGPMGLPAEGFGFSGNPGSIESLLEFRSVRLAVPRTNLSTRIRLRYP
ncbi:uncharacterized protein (DUF2141 family) [Novosphingobium sp. SG919]|nr:uncharacterized protein (DUF2141 family) [Novosphingobium sp. SG919]